MIEKFLTPFECPLERVEKAWIDHNGHMNMACYSLVFDRALGAVYEALGIGEGYLETNGCSNFTLEAHICYVREVHLGAPLRITWQLLDWDHKRLHFFEEMHHAEEGWLAATSEQLTIHVDMGSRRSAPFSAELQQFFDAVMAHHGALHRPERAGRHIAIAQ